MSTNNHRFNIIQKITNKIKIESKNEIFIGKNIKMSKCDITIKGKNNNLTIGNNTTLRKATIEIIGNNCSIQIGDNCMIGHNCYLSTKEENTHLMVGDDCGLSRNVKIMTSDGHPIFQNGQRINHAKNIILKKHIWVADNVTILKGVTIEDECVIGINSTVTKNIPSHSIAAGNPAIIVKRNIEWES